MLKFSKPTSIHMPADGHGWAFHVSEADLAALPGEAMSRNAYTPLAANGVIEAVSSDAADTTQKLTVIGCDSDGKLLESTITLNGTTAVDFTGAFHSVDFAYLNLKCAGTVTIRADGGGATVSTITIGEMRMDIAHHIIPSGRTGFITEFGAAGTTSTEILEFQLRYYPNIVDIRGPTVGFFLLDRILVPATVADVQHHFSVPLAAPFLGGYFAVFGGGAAGTGDGATTVVGYDV